MGLKPSEKSKKSEGLAALLRQEDPNERTTSPATEKLQELHSALRYVLNLDSRVALAEGGTILYDAVEEAIQERLSHFTTDTDVPAPRDGRLGPEQVEIDVASRFGRLAISEENRFTVKSKGNFSSCRATNCFFAGRWMYEAILGTGGIQQIGWATHSCPFNRERGVGDGEDSYAFDGKRVKKWSGDAENYGQSWAPGDVIGCCADFDEGELVFYRNGKSMGTAFREIRTMKPDLGYFPAISLSEDERCTLNFGAKPFYFPIEDYAPCQAPPPESERSRIEYLMRCLERLAEMTTPISTHAATTALFPRSKISVDEGVLLGAVLVQQLRPYLQGPFHVVNGVLASLRRIQSKTDTTSMTGLVTLMDTLCNALGDVEFESVMLCLLEHVADSCGVMPFRASELPYTASYPFLSLFVSLLKAPVVKRILFESEKGFGLLERCLVRKQPTTEDLKELLPSVWWKGCKDETMSEEIMNSLVSTLSTAYLKIEMLQFEMLLVLESEDMAQNSRLIQRPKKNLLGFLRYLLEKNAGASRNVPPPGLSNPTVMVSVFHFLMMLLHPYLVMQKTEGADILEEYPVRELFLTGPFGEERGMDDDLPRLGGLLSHLMKESAEGIPEIVSVVIDPDMFSSEMPRCHMLKDSIPSLLHILLLAFRLGPEAALKLCMKQFQSEGGQRNALLKMESKLVDPKVPEKEKKQLVSEIQKLKEEVIKGIRESAWCKLVWLTPSKQKSLFLLIVYLSKLMASISSDSSELLMFVPELYIEAVVEIFQALAEMEPRFANLLQLEIFGLQHIFSFFVTHFNHPKIINPQVCDSILQALTTIFADKVTLPMECLSVDNWLVQEFLKVCQRNPDARQHLIVGLLKGFDTRHWLPISNIFLSIGKGTGFGHASTSSGSPVFREFFATICSANLSLLDTFLNRLFNNLNWTLTELAIAVSELAEMLGRMPNAIFSVMSRQPRKASVLYSLSTNLLRLLELVAGQVPAAFLTGSKLNMTRVVEVAAYVLSHTTKGPDSLAFNTVVEAPQTGPEWKSKMSRLSILAPVAGILVYLHNNESHISRKPESQGSDGEVMHSIVKVLVEELSCSPDCLHYLSGLDWKSSYTYIHKKTHWIPRLTELLSDYDVEQRSKEQIPENKDSDEVPEEFLDPIMMTIMKDPVVLPDSKVRVDRSTIERHLLTSATDPFSRADLNRDMLCTDSVLQSRIAQWMDERCND